MSMEISGVGHAQVRRSGQGSEQPTQLQTEAARRQRGRVERQIEQSEPQIQEATQELRSVSLIFNRRLEFEINHDLDQVVVKVIDRETDKVIKELPPDEIQRLHVRIREAIGLLVDEEI
ncbi:MAG: flagellar protein FlaG [Spirochaetaceae bacterium]